MYILYVFYFQLLEFIQEEFTVEDKVIVFVGKKVM